MAVYHLVEPPRSSLRKEIPPAPVVPWTPRGASYKIAVARQGPKAHLARRQQYGSYYNVDGSCVGYPCSKSTTRGHLQQHHISSQSLQLSTNTLSRTVRCSANPNRTIAESASDSAGRLMMRCLGSVWDPMVSVLPPTSSRRQCRTILQGRHRQSILLAASQMC